MHRLFVKSITLVALLLTTVVHAAPVGPEIPHDLRVIYDAVLRKTGPRELSYEQDLLALARQDEPEGSPVPSGFGDEPNDGIGTFEPILPGISVPPANQFVTPDPLTDTPVPLTPEPSATPGVSPDASIAPTPMESPEPSMTFGPFPVESISPDPFESMDASSSPEVSDELTESISPAVSPDSEDDDSSVCFPAHATVQLEDGSVKRMDQIVLGDKVNVGGGQFSHVFMFTHKMAHVKYDFVRISTTADTSLALTKGHYLYVNGDMAAASTVNIGDTLQLADLSLTTVTQVSHISATGLYNPQTVQGDIVVDGIRASTYTTAVEPRLAHAMLAPVRAAFSRFGFSLASFEAGADRIASVLPSGSLVL